MQKDFIIAGQKRRERKASEIYEIEELVNLIFKELKSQGCTETRIRLFKEDINSYDFRYHNKIYYFKIARRYEQVNPNNFKAEIIQETDEDTAFILKILQTVFQNFNTNFTYLTCYKRQKRSENIILFDRLYDDTDLKLEIDLNSHYLLELNSYKIIDI